MDVSNFSGQLEEISVFEIRRDKELGLHYCGKIRNQSFISENQHYIKYSISLNTDCID